MEATHMRHARALTVAAVAVCLALGIDLSGGRRADCAPAASAPRSLGIPGLEGPVRIPVTIAADCQGTLALHRKNGQLVRILAQVVPLKAGTYDVLWDGMDLWGNLVPAGTDLDLTVITNTGVKAIYQMSVGSSGNPAWLTGRSTDQDPPRQGGSLGDHTGPSTVCALGDRMFFGSALVEHGHNLMATTIAGEKMWGTQVKGWDGPTQMATDGTLLYVVTRNQTVHSVDAQSFKVTRLFDVGEDPVVSLAATEGQLTFVLKNHAAVLDPFRRSKLAIDFARSTPSPGGGRAPEYQLSSQEQFATVFTSGGHFQTGLTPVMSDSENAYALVVFKEPADIGSLLVERMDGVDRAEYYTLKPGVEFARDRHAPVSAEKSATSGALADKVLSADWQPLGRTAFDRQVEVITAPKAGLKSSALLVWLHSSERGKSIGAIHMCRVLPLRVTRLPADIDVRLPERATPVPAKERLSRMGAKAVGWDVKTDFPINELNPLVVTLDLHKPITLQGLSLLNCTNPHVEISALQPGAGPDSDDASQWTFVTKHSATFNKTMGWSSAHLNSADRQIAFPEPITTQALRLKFTSGILPSRGPHRLAEDPQRSSCADITLLGLADPLPETPTRIVQTRDTAGKILSAVSPPKFPVRKIAYAPGSARTLYGITDKALAKLTLGASSVSIETLADGMSDLVSLAVGKDRIAVGDQGDHAIVEFDLSGKKLNTLGNKGPYRRGPYDPLVVNRPSSIAFASDGTLWFVEEAYHPKRMAHFAANGKHLRDLWGPPEYGGGGYLDPNLKSFYYRGMEFWIDFPRSEWGLKAFNDRYASEESPALDGSSFSYTHIGRPIILNGRKYIVGDPGSGVVICLLDNDVWKPVAVMGSANGNRFLTGKELWRAHWLKENLKDKAFIWCDRNGDGQYQPEEVELFDPPEKHFLGAAYWGSPIASDLTVFTGSRKLSPTRITDKGAPIYESKNLQAFDYAQLSDTYMANLQVGALAKRGYGGASIVAADGSLALEGQPYRVGTDLKIVGGAPLSTKPSDFVPPIYGLTLDNPLGFVGSAVTRSPVGEIAAMNGDNGPWFLWSTKYCCVVGRIFTGAKGGWSGVPNVRGTDVTENKQDWECFSGSFAKADDGNYYVVAGKGYHGISRLDGLDDFKVQTIPVAVTAESVAAARTFRATLIARAQAATQAKKANKEMIVQSLDKRTRDFKLDGDLADWRETKDSDEVDDLLAAARTEHPQVRVAADKDGLYLGLSGEAVLKNSVDDPKFIFKNGFCLEFAIRGNPKAKEARPVQGDKRLLIAPCKGKWIAVLLDYVDPALPETEYMEYNSPVLTTKVAHVTVLSDEQVKIAVKTGRATAKDALAGARSFAAEVFVSYKALGIAPTSGSTLRADFGVLSADVGGTAVERRWYWSNPNTDAITDMALEATIQPASFGTLRFE